MKPILIFLFFAGLFVGCATHANKEGGQLLTDTIVQARDTTIEDINDTNQQQQIAFDTDSAAIVDSLPNLNLVFDEITEKDFNKYDKAYKRNCEIDSSGFVKGYGLSIDTHCDEICETWLLENGSERKMLLPSSYDGGLGGLMLSPSCKQFITYSSYDGPEYAEFYSDRAEIIGYTLVNAKGLDAVKATFNFFTKDWSITKVVWVDEHAIVLKVYEGSHGGDEKNVKYKYLKTILK